MITSDAEKAAYLKVLSGPSVVSNDPVKIAQRDARAAADRAKRLAEGKARESTPAALEAKRARLAEIQADLLDVQVAEETARLEAKQVAARNFAARNAASGHGWTDRQKLRGDKQPPDIFHVEQPDGAYRPVGRSGRWHLVFGASGSAKTFLAAGWAAESLRKGQGVYWADFEDQGDDLPDMFRAFGVHDVQDNAGFHFFDPEAPPEASEVIAYCQEHGIKLVVMDAQRGAIRNAVPGDYGNSGDDVELFSSQLVRPLTRAGLTVVTIEHVGVSTTTGRPLGSERKISAVDIAFEAESGAEISEDAELGWSRLTVRKYRGGALRKGSVPAHMVYERGKASFKAEAVKPTLEGFTRQNGTVNRDLERVSDVWDCVRDAQGRGQLLTGAKLAEKLMSNQPVTFASEATTRKAIKFAAETGRIVAKPTGKGRELTYELPAA